MSEAFKIQKAHGTEAATLVSQFEKALQAEQLGRTHDSDGLKHSHDNGRRSSLTFKFKADPGMKARLELKYADHKHAYNGETGMCLKIDEVKIGRARAHFFVIYYPEGSAEIGICNYYTKDDAKAIKVAEKVLGDIDNMRSAALVRTELLPQSHINQ
jgi:hypothetical protein